MSAAFYQSGCKTPRVISALLCCSVVFENCAKCCRSLHWSLPRWNTKLLSIFPEFTTLRHWPAKACHQLCLHWLGYNVQILGACASAVAEADILRQHVLCVMNNQSSSDILTNQNTVPKQPRPIDCNDNYITCSYRFYFASVNSFGFFQYLPNHLIVEFNQLELCKRVTRSWFQIQNSLKLVGSIQIITTKMRCFT